MRKKSFVKVQIKIQVQEKKICSILTQDKYDLYSSAFHFSALALLARFFLQNTVKSTASLWSVICKRKQQFKELQNGLTA